MVCNYHNQMYMLNAMWSDRRVLEFARISMGGAYGKFKGCRTTKSKLKKFKSILAERQSRKKANRL